MRELYLVKFESANYAGHTALVWAESEEDALNELKESGLGEGFYSEQEEDQFAEENPDEYEEGGVCWSTTVCAYPLKGSEHKKFQNNSTQAEFYQVVN